VGGRESGGGGGGTNDEWWSPSTPGVVIGRKTTRHVGPCWQMAVRAMGVRACPSPLAVVGARRRTRGGESANATAPPEEQGEEWRDTESASAPPPARAAELSVACDNRSSKTDAEQYGP
jgi:hypothetical protein